MIKGVCCSAVIIVVALTAANAANAAPNAYFHPAAPTAGPAADADTNVLTRFGRWVASMLQPSTDGRIAAASATAMSRPLSLRLSSAATSSASANGNGNAATANVAARYTLTPAHEGRAGANGAVYQPFVLESTNARSYMQTADTPQSMNDAAYNAIHSIKRKGLGNVDAPDYFDVDMMGGVEFAVYPGDPNAPYSDSESRDNAVQDRQRLYAEGIALIPAGVPLVLALASIFGWMMFCWLRCCCDTCGGRVATMKYTAEQRNVCRVLIVVNFAFMVIVFGFGMSANAGVSNSVDSIASSADQAVDYLFSYHAILSEGIVVIADAFSKMSTLEESIAVLPSGPRVANYTMCINDVYATLNFQNVLLGRIVYLQNVTNGMPDMHAFAADLRQFDANIKALPNLVEMENNMKALNTSMDAIPLPTATTPEILLLNSSFNLYKADPTNSTSALYALANAVATFSSRGISDTLVRNHDAFNAFPNLLQVSDEVGNTNVNGFCPSATCNGPAAATRLLTLRDRLDAMTSAPNFGQFAVMLQTLNTTFARFNDSFVLIPSLTRLQSIVSSWHTLVPLRGQVNGLRSFQVDGPPQISVLTSQVSRCDASIRGFPNMNLFTASIRNVDVGVERLNNGNITLTMRDLQTFNVSLPRMACILPVFDSIEAINNTLVALPDSLNQTLALRPGVEAQLANTTQTQHDINAGYQALKDLNQTLSVLPNFADLLNQTIAVNNTLNTLPNLQQVLAQLQDLNQSVYAMPDMSLYQTQLSALSTQLMQLTTPNLDAVVIKLVALRGILANVMPPVAAYVESAVSFHAIAATTRMRVENTRALFAGPTYPLDSFTNPTLSVMQQTLADLIVLYNARPNMTALRESLREVNETVITLPDLPSVGAIVASFDRNVYREFPSLNTLQTSAHRLAASKVAQIGLTQIISDGSLTALNRSLTALPDLYTAANNSDDAQTQIDGARFAEFISELNEIGTTFSNAARQDAVDQLAKIDDFRAGLPDIHALLTQLNDTKLDGESAQHSMVNYHNDYYYYRNLGVLYANEYDGQRVLFINFLFFMPMFLAFLGVLGCALQKPCPLMWLALASLPMMAVIFLFCAVVMIPAVATGDFCEARDTIVVTNIAHTEVSASALEFGRDDTKLDQPGAFNTSEAQNLTAADLYAYFVTCQQPKVQSLISQMKDPQTILRRAGYNVSDTLGKVRTSAQEQGYVLRPRVSGQIDAFNGPYGDAQTVLLLFGNALQCSDDNALHLAIAAFYDGVCTRLATSLAMCTALLFIAAACSLPGVCIGIRAYKRLDPANFSTRVKKDDDDDDTAAADGENKLDDGHASRKAGAGGAAAKGLGNSGNTAADRDAAKVAAMMAVRADPQKPAAASHAHHAVHPSMTRAPQPMGSSIGGAGQTAAPRYTPVAESRPIANSVEMGGVRALQFDAAGNLIS